MSRLVALTLAAACLLLPAAGADAAIRVGPGLTSAAPDLNPICPGAAASCTLVGTRHEQVQVAAPIDGVIVRWRARAATAGPATFRVVEVAPDGRVRGLAADAQALTAGVDVFPVRIPVTRGARIGLTAAPAVLPLRDLGASAAGAVRYAPAGLGPVFEAPGTAVDGAELLVNADVEPDADRDGRGDETQDECPGDAERWAAPCSGRRIGPEITGPSWERGIDACPDCLQAATGNSDDQTVPADGVIVRWRARLAGGSIALNLLTPDGSGGYARAASTAHHPAPVPGAESLDMTAIATFPDRLPVRAGQVVAMHSEGLTQIAYRSTAAMGGLGFAWVGALPESGPLGPPRFSVPDLGFAYNADLEPDADGDGFGDVTQDGCPSDAARQGACAAAPAPAPASPLPGTAPPGPARTAPPRATTTVAAARLAATRLRWNGRSALAPRLACPKAAPATCRGTLELRRGTRRVGRATFVVPRGATRAVRIRVKTTLPRRGPLRLTAVVTPRGGKPARTALTVTRAK